MRDRGQISGFVENHTTTKASFTVTTKIAQLQRYIDSGLEKVFKLETSLPTTNMHAFDVNGKIEKYERAEDIADAFFPIRMALYEDRKSVLESELNYEATMFRSKARFIEDVTNGDIELAGGGKSEGELLDDLLSRKYSTMPELLNIKHDNVLAKRRKIDPIPLDLLESEARIEDFSYLLSMPLSSLTREKTEALRRDAEAREADLAAIRNTSAADLWRQDLDKLESMLKREYKE